MRKNVLIFGLITFVLVMNVLHSNAQNVTGVSLNLTSAILLKAGDTQQLTATIYPNNAADKSVTWSTSDANIATVDVNGLVTVVEKGIVAITVTTVDGSFHASCTISQNVIQIEAEGFNGSAAVGIRDEDGGKTVGWFNSGATLSFNNVNVVAGIYNVLFRADSWGGGSQLTLKSAEGSKIYCSVDVPNGYNTVTATNVTFSDGKVNLMLVGGGTQQAVNWIDLQLVSTDIPVPVTEVSISPVTASINVGFTQQLTAALSPANATNKNITWSSSNTNVATVDALTGLVTAVAGGSAIITVMTSDGDKTATCEVTVISNNIRIEAESFDSQVGGTGNRTEDGGTTVGWFDTGETLTYNNVNTLKGIYNVLFRANGWGTGNQLTLMSADGSINYCTVDVPFGYYSTITASNVSFGTGPLNLMLVGSGEQAVNWFELQPVSISTDIHNSSVSSINIYPNPTTKYVTIDNISARASVRIVGIDGKTILNQKTESNQLVVSVSNWKKGVYLLTVQTENKTIVKKLIVE